MLILITQKSSFFLNKMGEKIIEKNMKSDVWFQLGKHRKLYLSGRLHGSSSSVT